MADKCFITGCKVDRSLYVIKIKKQEEGEDKVYKACREHRDAMDKACTENGWEFQELSA